jgi:hypothetical protein
MRQEDKEFLKRIQIHISFSHFIFKLQPVDDLVTFIYFISSEFLIICFCSPRVYALFVDLHETVQLPLLTYEELCLYHS